MPYLCRLLLASPLILAFLVFSALAMLLDSLLAELLPEQNIPFGPYDD